MESMDEHEWLAEQFEANRTQLQAVAYRMLGSLSEADDAVQESWLRLSRSETSGIENLGGWLTTVVARICLDMLRLRVCQERSAVRQQWPGSSQDVLRAHERLSWREPWQLWWRRVDICSSSSISRSATTRSSRLRRSPILHACASCTLQSSTTDEPPPVKRRMPVRRYCLLW